MCTLYTISTECDEDHSNDNDDHHTYNDNDHQHIYNGDHHQRDGGDLGDHHAHDDNDDDEEFDIDAFYSFNQSSILPLSEKPLIQKRTGG